MGRQEGAEVLAEDGCLLAVQLYEVESVCLGVVENVWEGLVDEHTNTFFVLRQVGGHFFHKA